MKHLCAVRHCTYIAEGDLGKFPVCVLHDALQTEGILENLEMPGAYWMRCATEDAVRIPESRVPGIACGSA